jgi:predicted nucleic acid-binding protein
MICCDTSFLVSLYGNDIHTAKATHYLRNLGSALTLSPFNEFELLNAIELRVWLGFSSRGQADRVLAAWRTDLEQAVLYRPTLNLAAVLAEARRLSASFTARGGHRSFDILHIAAAVHLGTSEFLTFDQNQRKLAVATGLTASP